MNRQSGVYAIKDLTTGLKVGPMSDAQKSAIAASKRGKPLSAEHRQRIREGLLARKQGASDAC